MSFCGELNERCYVIAVVDLLNWNQGYIEPLLELLMFLENAYQAL